MFDVLAWCYLFTGIWHLSAEAPCSYWLWLISYRMTAVSAAGMGVLISIVVPEHSATLAISLAVIATWMLKNNSLKVEKKGKDKKGMLNC